MHSADLVGRFWKSQLDPGPELSHEPCLILLNTIC
jgi:hypothetical protein